MVYVENIMMTYGGSVELHKFHTQEKKFNTNTKNWLWWNTWIRKRWTVLVRMF